MLAVSFDAFRLDTCLALRSTLPTHFRAFVTADMDIFAGEKRCDFIENILQELERFFLSGTQYDVFYPPDDTRCGRFALARQFGICGDCSQLVSRKFDFRNDRDKTVCCLLYHFLDLVLRIKTAIFRSFAIYAFGTDFCQFWVFLDFDTPALVVRQMPMHAVDLEQS